MDLFEFVHGIVKNKMPGYIVIEVNGVGFGLKVSDSTVKELPEVGQLALVYTYLHVREDALMLFGFASPLERTLFNLLLGVEGIGPRVALAVLSTFSATEFVRAVRIGDVSALLRVSGVGKKTAQRIVLELKEKVRALTNEPEELSTPETEEDDLTVAALLHLGYSPEEIQRALKQVPEGQDVALRVRAALEILRKR